MLTCDSEQTWLRRGGLTALLTGLLLPLAACGGFFVCQNRPGCPSTGGGTGGGGGTTPLDVAFVSYTTAAGNSVITGFNVAGGALTPINTVTTPYVPVAMAISAKNDLLYVATRVDAATPGIYAYTISTTGSLAAASGGAALVVDPLGAGAMTISPDGNYLYTLENATQVMYQYTVTQSTGALGPPGAIGTLGLSCALTVSTTVLPSCSVAVAPKGGYAVATGGSLGDGDSVFAYGSTTGISPPALAIIAPTAGVGDFSVAIDGNNYAYIAQTGTLTLYSLAPTGVTKRAVYTYPVGSIPRSTVVDGGSQFVYTANVGTSKITGLTAGTIVELTGSPYAAPANVSALGIDSTNSYVVAAGYDAKAGVQLYSIATTGVLSPLAATAATSTAKTYPVLVAMTH